MVIVHKDGNIVGKGQNTIVKNHLTDNKVSIFTIINLEVTKEIFVMWPIKGVILTDDWKILKISKTNEEKEV